MSPSHKLKFMDCFHSSVVNCYSIWHVHTLKTSLMSTPMVEPNHTVLTHSQSMNKWSIVSLCWSHKQHKGKQFTSLKQGISLRHIGLDQIIFSCVMIDRLEFKISCLFLRNLYADLTENSPTLLRDLKYCWLQKGEK